MTYFSSRNIVIGVSLLVIAGILWFALNFYSAKTPGGSLVQPTVDSESEYLSLPGSGIWFAYPKGWYESYYDPSDEKLHVPKDSPGMIWLTDHEVPHATSGDLPGSEVIEMSIFTRKVFDQYKKNNQLSYYFAPGFEKIYANTSGQTTWTNGNGFHVTEVLQPSYKTLIDPGPSPTPHVLAGIYWVELKNGSLLIVTSHYAMTTADEDAAKVEAHRAALSQKTRDVVQSIRPL
ncbi:hypothetical protein HY624_03225 [Candidatus Uhrbacteria bacterium]|nr:hypothetical protein [Candidatus Uhrbacteria bacterium]